MGRRNPLFLHHFYLFKTNIKLCSFFVSVVNSSILFGVSHHLSRSKVFVIPFRAPKAEEPNITQLKNIVIGNDQSMHKNTVLMLPDTSISYWLGKLIFYA